MDSGGVALGTPVEQPSQAFVPQELHRYKTVQEEITNLTNEQVAGVLLILLGRAASAEVLLLGEPMQQV